MIITLTPNPSVDRTVFLDDVVLGSVNRSQRRRSEPSGKGVNVALALHAHDVPVRAVVTAGGSVGVQLRQMLDTAGLDTVSFPSPERFAATSASPNRTAPSPRSTRQGPC